MPESAAFFAIQFGIHRFAIIFQNEKPVRIGKFSDDIQRRGIAENGNRHDRPRSRRQRPLKLRGVDIKRLKLDIDKGSRSPYCCSG